MRAWLDETRDWFAIKEIDLSPDAKLSELDAGEVEAIELVKQLNADGLIIDDRAGRDEARKRGIFVIGTLGVLNAAAERGLIDLPETLRKLQQTSFRASDKLISELIQLDSERKRPH